MYNRYDLKFYRNDSSYDYDDCAHLTNVREIITMLDGIIVIMRAMIIILRETVMITGGGIGNSWGRIRMIYPVLKRSKYVLLKRFHIMNEK